MRPTKLQRLVLAGVDTIATPPGIDIARTLRMTAARHDIGKGIAVQASGDSTTQHRHTVPLLSTIMWAAGFNAEEVNLARQLVGNDILGQLAQGQLGDHHAADHALLSRARRTGLSEQDYFRMQALLGAVRSTWSKSWPCPAPFRILRPRTRSGVPTDPR